MTVASVRCSRAIPPVEASLTSATCAGSARARTQSADGRSIRPPSSLPSLLLEDPTETDENVARTLAETFEWRAELARAADLLKAAEQSTRHDAPHSAVGSDAWSRVCAPPARQRAELAPYLLASLDGIFPRALAHQLQTFLAGSGSRLHLPPMEGGQRLAMHQLANGLMNGLTSKSEGSGDARHVVWYRSEVENDERGRGTALRTAARRDIAHEAAPPRRSRRCSLRAHGGTDGREDDEHDGDAPAQQRANVFEVLRRGQDSLSSSGGEDSEES